MRSKQLKSKILLLLLLGWAGVGNAQENVVFYFESDRMPAFVLWHGEETGFLEPVAAKDFEGFFAGVTHKPSDQKGLSYIVLEKTADGFVPLKSQHGQVIREAQLEERKERTQSVRQYTVGAERELQSKKTKVALLRRAISEKIPIEEILELRRQKEELEAKKRQLDAEAIVVEQSLKNLDKSKIDRQDIASQERQLQQLNQELRIGLDGRKSVR